jgi:hypothetical protein
LLRNWWRDSGNIRVEGCRHQRGNDGDQFDRSILDDHGRLTHFGTLRLSLDQFDDFPHELVKGEQVDIFGRNRSPLHLVME